MSELLCNDLDLFDVIISSPKLRAIKTCELSLQASLVDSYPGKDFEDKDIPLDQEIINCPVDERTQGLKEKFSIRSEIREISFGKLEDHNIDEIKSGLFYYYFSGKVKLF